MKEYNTDTSSDYEDLVGYFSEDNLPNNNLASLLDMEEEYKPKVKPKAVDANFPEQWQNLYVNFNNLEEYAKFMKEMGEAATPKLKEIIYDPKGRETNVMDFFGE